MSRLVAEPPFALEALSQAVNYQRWISRTIAPFIGKRVLEIGAGMGNMSRWLGVTDRLILTESEPALVESLKASMDRRYRDDPRVSVIRLDVLEDDLSPLAGEDLDTIVSFNVLEHIEDDARALRKLSELALSGGAPGPRRVLTFVPAHQWAYGTLDRGLGHFRRYSRADLEALCRFVAPQARLRVDFFNTIGLAGWLWKGRVLKQEKIGAESVALFDALCPFLGPADDFLRGALKVPMGQSLLAVMEWG